MSRRTINAIEPAGDLGFALQAHGMRILSQDPGAFSPGHQPVPDSVNRAIAEHGLRTLSSVDLDWAVGPGGGPGHASGYQQPIPG